MLNYKRKETKIFRLQTFQIASDRKSSDSYAFVLKGYVRSRNELKSRNYSSNDSYSSST